MEHNRRNTFFGFCCLHRVGHVMEVVGQSHCDMVVGTGPFMRQKRSAFVAYFSGCWPGLGDHWTFHGMPCWIGGLRVWWSGREMEGGFENPSKGEVLALRMLSFSSARCPLINVF